MNELTSKIVQRWVKEKKILSDNAESIEEDLSEILEETYQAGEENGYENGYDDAIDELKEGGADLLETDF